MYKYHLLASVPFCPGYGRFATSNMSLFIMAVFPSGFFSLQTKIYCVRAHSAFHIHTQHNLFSHLVSGGNRMVSFSGVCSFVCMLLVFRRKTKNIITWEWASPHVCCRNRSRTFSRRSFVIVEFAVVFVMILIDSISISIWLLCLFCFLFLSLFLIHSCAFGIFGPFFSVCVCVCWALTLPWLLCALKSIEKPFVHSIVFLRSIIQLNNSIPTLRRVSNLFD